MEQRPYRSLFWPILLIGIGVIWLLGNFGLIPNTSLSLLINLWPLILVVIGLDLLFGRSSPIVGGLIGLLLVGAIIAALVLGPSIGLRLPSGANAIVERFNAPLEGAKEATVRISSVSQPVEIQALNGGDQLIDAEIGHYGQMDFRVSGSDTKTVVLQRDDGTPGAWFFNAADPDKLKWKINLSGQIPLTLQLDSGSGPLAMDLSGLQLAGLSLDSGSGPVSMTLPEADGGYTAEVNSGSGPVSATLPGSTDLTLILDTGSGPVSLRVPQGAALRVEVRDSGSGPLNFDAGLERVSGSGNDDEGVWETSGYEQAAHKIFIRVDSFGSGSLRVQ